MADRLQDLLNPHLTREARLKEEMNSLMAQLDRVRFELGGVQQRIQGIKDAAEAFQVGDTPKRAKRTPVTRNRGMSGHWQRMMQMVDLLHETFTYNDLANAAAAAQQNLSNEALRSQMSDYKARGWVQSAGLGAFRLTDIGRRVAGIPIDNDDKNKAPGVGAPGAFGRVAELEDPEKSEQRPFRKGENVGSSPTPPASRPEPQPPSWDSDDDVPF